METQLEDPIVYSPDVHSHLLPAMANIHAACITTDNTLATFLPPLSHKKILTSWQEWSSEIESGHRVIFLQMAGIANEGEKTLAGVVSLYFPETETGSQRGQVGRLLVSPDWRYRGIARRLLGALEKVALEKGRWLLVSMPY